MITAMNNENACKKKKKSVSLCGKCENRAGGTKSKVLNWVVKLFTKWTSSYLVRLKIVFFLQWGEVRLPGGQRFGLALCRVAGFSAGRWELWGFAELMPRVWLSQSCEWEQPRPFQCQQWIYSKACRMCSSDTIWCVCHTKTFLLVL